MESIKDIDYIYPSEETKEMLQDMINQHQVNTDKSLHEKYDLWFSSKHEGLIYNATKQLENVLNKGENQITWLSDKVTWYSDKLDHMTAENGSNINKAIKMEITQQKFEQTLTYKNGYDLSLALEETQFECYLTYYKKQTGNQFVSWKTQATRNEVKKDELIQFNKARMNAFTLVKAHIRALPTKA